MGDINLNALSTFKHPRRVKIESKVPVREFGKDSPGPKYDPVDCTLTKARSLPSVKMSLATKEDKKEVSASPGPGAYGAPGPGGVQTGRGFSFGASAKLARRALRESPGPGHYPVKSTLGGMCSSMTAAPKGSVNVSKVPGPGSYAPSFKQLEESAPSMPFTEALKKTASNKSPGPGAYEMPSTLNGNCTMKRSPGVLVASSGFIRARKDITPGPCGPMTTFKIP
mmetsp:Transcript_117001/g.331101  ORF Transcript_117001/g.331101 Transcript_117001/m.331101 type:complete len:225 (-) Transcript_117001:45-719(-)